VNEASTVDIQWIKTLATKWKIRRGRLLRTSNSGHQSERCIGAALEVTRCRGELLQIIQRHGTEINGTEAASEALARKKDVARDLLGQWVQDREHYRKQKALHPGEPWEQYEIVLSKAMNDLRVRFGIESLPAPETQSNEQPTETIMEAAHEVV